MDAIGDALAYVAPEAGGMVGPHADVLVHVEDDDLRPVDVTRHQLLEEPELRVARREHRVRRAPRSAPRPAARRRHRRRRRCRARAPMGRPAPTAGRPGGRWSRRRLSMSGRGCADDAVRHPVRPVPRRPGRRARRARPVGHRDARDRRRPPASRSGGSRDVTELAGRRAGTASAWWPCSPSVRHPGAPSNGRRSSRNVRAGRTAVVAVHAATDSCHGWSDYGRLVGRASTAIRGPRRSTSR